MDDLRVRALAFLELTKQLLPRVIWEPKVVIKASSQLDLLAQAEQYLKELMDASEHS